MKFSFLFSLSMAVMLMASCEKDGDDILISNTPRSEVPAQLTGKWQNGTFSMSNWWSYNGTKYEGNPYTRSTSFNFSKNGDAEFFQVIKTYNGSCATEGFTYYKGSVKFNDADNSFTVYPQKGNYRGYYSCASGSNFNRAAEKNELKPITLYWSEETLNGQKYMVVAFTPGAVESEKVYFKPSNW